MTTINFVNEKALIATLMEAVYNCGQKGSQVYMTNDGIKKLQHMMKHNKVLVVDFTENKMPDGWSMIEGGNEIFNGTQKLSSISVNSY